MGAGRKTQMILGSEKPRQSSSLPANMSASARNLHKRDLGGAIFGCNNSTKGECLGKQLFGLPSPHFSFVRNITPGLPLFLFNYYGRTLYGIYEAASNGELCIDPYAWTEDGKERTTFPAQVRIRIRTQCQPLTEKQYSKIIKDNYYSEKHFFFELDHAQTEGLVALFESSTIPFRKGNMYPASQSNKWMDSGSGEPKRYSKPSFGSTNADKYVSLDWDNEDIEDGSSSKRSTSDAEESEIREHVLGRDAVWAGEHLEGGYSDFCTQPDGESLTWHGSWREMSVSVPEKREFKDLDSQLESYWEENVQGSRSVFSPNPIEDISLSKAPITSNEREFCVPTSDLEAGRLLNNLQDSHSGVSLNLDGEKQTFLEQRSGVEGFEKVLQKLQELSAGREHSVFSSKDFMDDSDMHGDVHDETRSSKESVLVEENKTPPNLSRDVREESGLSKESFYLAQKQENKTTPDLYLGNTELVHIIKELIETTAALKKKQVESDLEIQQLRNVVKVSGKVFEEQKGRIKELESQLFLVNQHLGLEKPIYLIGGFNGTSWLSSLDSFSPANDILKPLRSMSSARSYASTAALNGNLYVFGGGDGNSWFDTVECYSPRDNDWTLFPHLIRPKGSLAGATLNSKIFAIGGGDGNESFQDVEMFDPALGKWVNIQPMFQKRFATAAAELHGVIYAVGGYDGNSYLQSVERYDQRVARWARAPSMKTRRGCHSLAVLNEKIYAVGGYDGENMVPTVEVFDPRLDTWMMGDSMSSARGYSAAAVLGDSLFVIGGIKGGEDILDTVECYKEGAGWAIARSEAMGRRSFLSALVV